VSGTAVVPPLYCCTAVAILAAAAVVPPLLPRRPPALPGLACAARGRRLGGTCPALPCPLRPRLGCSWVLAGPQRTPAHAASSHHRMSPPPSPQLLRPPRHLPGHVGGLDRGWLPWLRAGRARQRGVGALGPHQAQGGPRRCHPHAAALLQRAAVPAGSTRYGSRAAVRLGAAVWAPSQPGVGAARGWLRKRASGHVAEGGVETAPLAALALAA
jgi:hypothetical protein